jgi:hypothetical protein
MPPSVTEGGRATFGKAMRSRPLKFVARLLGVLASGAFLSSPSGAASASRAAPTPLGSGQDLAYLKAAGTTALAPTGTVYILDRNHFAIAFPDDTAGSGFLPTSSERKTLARVAHEVVWTCRRMREAT